MMWVQRTVDGSPVEVGSLSQFLQGVYTSQVLQDFFHQQYEYPDVG